MELYSLLEEAASHHEMYNRTGLVIILGWQPSSLAFEIRRPDLMEDLLKRCMKGSYPKGMRYIEFQDILSRFEFEPIRSRKVTGWCNDLFRRGAEEAVEWLQPRAPPPKSVDFMSLRQALEAMGDVPLLKRLYFTLSNAKNMVSLTFCLGKRRERPCKSTIRTNLKKTFCH